jgi:hypothetical protein
MTKLLPKAAIVVLATDVLRRARRLLVGPTRNDLGSWPGLFEDAQDWHSRGRSDDVYRENCGLLLQPHLILHLRILGFSDSGVFFRQWRRRMNTGAGNALCALFFLNHEEHEHETYGYRFSNGLRSDKHLRTCTSRWWCRRRGARSRWRDHWRRESAPQAISPSRKCAPAPFLSQTKRAVASWAFSGGFPTHGDDIPLRARPRQLVMREATEPRRSAPISG